MKLGMDRDETIKKLLSPEMLYIYQKMKKGGVSLRDYIPSDSDNDSDLFKETIKDMTTIAALIMKRSIDYTPVDTGKLVKSIYIRNEGPGIAIGYKADYAIHVHEIGFYNHEEPTRYKYLEEAAFEISIETETTYRISISYDPLEVYINVPNKGVELVDIKNREKSNKLLETKKRVFAEYVDFNEETASDVEKIYHEKMKQFFEYWRRSNHGDWWILDEWQDRTRHD